MTGDTPAFVLAGPDQTLLVERAAARFDTVDAARAALRDGRAPLVVGALPFHRRDPAALLVPAGVHRSDTAPPAPPGAALPAVRLAAELPAPAQHRERVRQAVTRLRAADGALHKVVLARALRLLADAPLDPALILHRLLAADPTGYGYLVDLSAAGGAFAGGVLVGASPELLVARAGERVSCRPFAGSAPRSADPVTDAANGAALAASAKNRHEHRLVVEQLHDALAPLCRELRVAPEPELTRTAAVWHLNTPITGRLRESSTSALDLAIALHPTAAVGGVPTAAAVQLIDELEDDRGFYAGAVGWCDATGDGRWVVSIRCAQLSADRRSALAHAGGGIVAESDPDEEVAETSAKFGTILAALGLGRPSAGPPG